MYTYERMPAADWKTGSLTNGNPTKISMSGAPLPSTITLNSTAAGRKVMIGTNGADGEFYAPSMDVNSSTMVIVVVRTPISYIQLTGAAGDTWKIR